MYLIEASPSVGSLAARPLEAHEIDAMPDGDRVWATIIEIRSAMREISEEEREAAETEVEEEIEQAVSARENEIALTLSQVIETLKGIVDEI